MLAEVKEASNSIESVRSSTTTRQDYEGGLKDNFPHGDGIYTWKDGTAFTGTFVTGKILGKGTYTWPSGCVYDGDVKDAYRHGKGSLTFDDRPAKYSGNWTNGKRSGKGVLSYDDENTCQYEGDWKNGLRHGFGTMKYHSGNSYEGEWRNGCKCGRGTMKWLNRNEEYVGEWKDGLPNGLGAYTWRIKTSSQDTYPGHNRYEGWWVNGMRSGNGVFTYASGARYDGEWKDNLKHGRGTFTSEDGRKYTGTFEMDRMVGDFSSFNNESPFQFRFADLIPANDGLSLEQHSKMINSVVTRHTATLRKLYHRLCMVADKQSLPADDVCGLERVQLWHLFRECKLLAKGVTLVDLDRVLARGFQGNDAFSPFFTDPHTPSASFILRDFIELLLRVAWLVYGNSSEPVTEAFETGPAASLNRLLVDDVLPNCSVLTGIPAVVGVGRADKREMFLQQLTQEYEPKYRESLYKVYCNLSRTRKDSVPNSMGDVTMTMRDAMLSINNYEILCGKEGIALMSAFLRQASQKIPISTDDGDSYNLEYEIVSLEFFDLIMMALLLRYKDLVDGSLGLTTMPTISSTEAFNRSGTAMDEGTLRRSSSSIVNNTKDSSSATNAHMKPLGNATRQRRASHSQSNDGLDHSAAVAAAAAAANAANRSKLKSRNGIESAGAVKASTGAINAINKDLPSKVSQGMRARTGSVSRPTLFGGVKGEDGESGSKGIIHGEEEPVTRSRGDVTVAMSRSQAFQAQLAAPIFKSPEESKALV
ncbi:hypothetical protein SmJEL517_g00191 [Synchytrium microbalum]|uniref:Uncharacterized protein n=1 Tax=Synchytrium microbalum TaxID=1806994 RepID=A0A507CFG8_9FUNG|nr:uncharacterized protein SmJEL517_g00191 [Synchytrium microbalum]TPX38372.1 hypothetical protein SmJEL517_g00191 [Synchytrium microbalum]